MMLANHLTPLSFINRLTHAPLFVDGAQGFVFLSGFVLGMVHQRRRNKLGATAARMKLLSRAAQLHATHLVLVALALTGAMLVSIPLSALGQPAGRSSMSLLFDLLFLRWQPPYLDILPLYIILIVLSPLPLWLMERGLTFLVLLGSALLYATVQAFPGLLEFRHATASGGMGLLPTAWQLLFYGGLMLGFHRATQGPQPGLLPGASPLRGVAVVLFAVCFALAQLQRPALAAWNPLPTEALAWWLDKAQLGPGRVVYFASAIITAETLVRVLIGGNYLTRFLAGLEALGRNSLYTYVVHLIMLGVLVWLGWRELPAGLADGLLLLLLALLGTMIRRDILRRIIPN